MTVEATQHVDRWTIAVVLMVLILLAAALWVIFAVGALAVKIATATIGIAGTLVLAATNHTLQLEKDRVAAQQAAKQENYKDLLSKVGAFARDLPGADDALTTAHLASWAFGDLDVLEATNRFQDTRDRESLLALLQAVRKNLQHDELPADFQSKYNAQVLFPRKERVVPEITPGLK